MIIKRRLLLIHDWEEKAREANYNVENLARMLRCSVRHLERFFRETKNTTPHAWMADLRLSDSTSELMSKQLSVKEAAARAGFTAPHFCREFRRVHGISPGAAALEPLKGSAQNGMGWQELRATAVG